MRDLVYWPDPILTKPTRSVTDDELKSGVADGVKLSELVEEMILLMRTSRIRGAGLAAPQVGSNLSLFIVDVPAKEAGVIVCINPILSDFMGSEEDFEGCLSLPGIRIKVKRAQTVKVAAKRLDGQPFEFSANAMLARVCQHEFDHLMGKLILSKGSRLVDRKINDRLAELEAQYKRWTSRKKPPSPAN